MSGNKVRASLLVAYATLGLGLGWGLGCSGGGVPVTPDLTSIPLDMTVLQDLAKKCVSTCTTDSQCASSCPAPSTGLNCCDTQTNTCFVTQQSACPPPPDLLSTSMY